MLYQPVVEVAGEAAGTSDIVTIYGVAVHILDVVAGDVDALGGASLAMLSDSVTDRAGALFAFFVGLPIGFLPELDLYQHTISVCSSSPICSDGRRISVPLGSPQRGG